MTKQSVVVPESGGISVAAVQYPVGIKKPSPPPATVEAGGGGGINGWIETMRSSSPPPPARAAVVAAGEEADLRAKWAASHPSALAEFDKIAAAAKGKQIVMFLDYDGTLSPIVSDPDAAFMPDKMRRAVRRVARHFPTAIVSGRCRKKVFDFVRLSELYYAGSHGMDIEAPATKASPRRGGRASRLLFQPASQFLPMIQELYGILVEKTKAIAGAKVENNVFCLSVHFRCVDEKSWSPLAELVRNVLEEYPLLSLSQGRKVLEIRPMIKWDKGRALEFLLESLGFAESSEVMPVYIGDDRTDEDAFRVLRERGQGIGIVVSKVPRETDAFYSLQEPNEVMEFLIRLVDWKRSSTSS